MQKIIIVIFSFFLFFSSQAQRTTQLSKKEWVDSVFKTLNDNDKISQLIVVRLTSIDTKTGTVTWYGNEVEAASRQYNIGGICLF